MFLSGRILGMNRWLLAMVMVLGPLAGLASADYVIIKIDLHKAFSSQNDKNPGGMQSYPGMYGGAGAKGGLPGASDTGTPGYPGGRGYPGGPMGGGGYPGGPM